MFDHTKKDSKSIGSAIVDGVGQVVDPYKLGPENSDTKNSTATAPIDDTKPSASPESSPESKSAQPLDAFRPKGRITTTVQGPHKPKPKPKPKPTSESTNKPRGDSSTPPSSTDQEG